MDLLYYRNLYNTLSHDVNRYVPVSPETSSITIIYYMIGICIFIALMWWGR